MTLTRRDHAAGFTLVEILLAVAITAIIMTAVAGAFLGILRTREDVRAMSDSTSAGPRILALLERDLRGLWHHNIKDNKVFLGRNQDINGFPTDRMDFLCTTDAIGAVEDGTGQARHPTICEVGYWLKPNERYGDLRELWRREDPMVDDDLTMGGKFQLVHDRIKTFDVTYYKTLGAEAEPLHEWDSSRMLELPRRIKIEFTVERKLPNRNRITGAEVSDFEDAVKKYTRHIVFDRRYPEILRAGIALVPLLPAPPQAESLGPIGGGGGPTGGGGKSSEGPAVGGSRSVGGVGTRAGGGPGQPGPGPGGPGLPPGGFNLNGFLGGGQGGGGGLFGGGGGMFGGGGR